MTFLDASVPIGRHWRVGPLSMWGKLPSQGDFLRHRTTVAQARDWQDWVDRVWARRPGAQEGQRRQALAWTASGREILPPPRISSDLADLPVTFVMQPGTLPFAPRHCVQGVAVASSDETGRACPLIFFQRVTRGWLRRSWQGHESTRSHVDVLHALSRLAARIPAPGTDAATVIRAVDALDALYRPGWPHWFGEPLPTPSRLQLDALLRSHLGGHATDLAADLQGVMHMPWAGWPSQIVRERSPTSAFWQQDAHGGHLGASDDLARLGAGVATGSAAPTPRDAATGPQLVGLRHHGMEFDFRWTWGVGPDTQGFDGILPEGMLPSLAGRGGLAAIALHRDGPDDRAHWWISNQGGALACAVNGRLLARDDRQRLDHGDDIEVGLTRLRVLLHDRQDIPRVLSRTEPGPFIGPARDSDLEAFDLAGLALPRPAVYGDGLNGMRVPRSDFSDLIALDHDEPMAQDCCNTDARPTGNASAGDITAIEATVDPLQALHARYLARLRDPAHDAENHAWQDLVRSQPSARSDPMRQWMEAAGGEQGVDDLLDPTSSITDLIDAMDAPCAVDVLSPRPHESVLHLFAPEGLRGRDLPAVSRNLPGLTRREHHSLSPDSAMTLPSVSAGEPKDTGPMDTHR